MKLPEFVCIVLANLLLWSEKVYSYRIMLVLRRAISKSLLRDWVFF